MKSYHSIPTLAEVHPKDLQQKLYVFDKLDGSNIRAEWDPKQGWFRFGSRKLLMEETHPTLGKAIALFREKYGDSLPKIFKSQKWKKVVAFFEFYGPKSIAGDHDPDDNHTVTLFDLSVDNRGVLHPEKFVELFRDLGIPRLLHTGEVDDILVAQIREGSLDGMTYEGVICKGDYISPGRPFMVKIKNQAWVTEISERYKDNPQELQNRL